MKAKSKSLILYGQEAAVLITYNKPSSGWSCRGGVGALVVESHENGEKNGDALQHEGEPATDGGPGDGE